MGILKIETWQWRDTRFNIKEHLQSTQYEKYSQRQDEQHNSTYSYFERLKKEITEHFTNKFEKGKAHEQEIWLEKLHQAIIGESGSIEWIKREIEEFLRKSDSLGAPYPPYYSDILEAAYQETYGIGAISTWWKHPRFPDSEASRILGTNIFFEIPGEKEELQKIRYMSEKDVLRVAKQLSLRNKNSSFNAHNPSLQIDMQDGTRVTIMIPPWSVRPTLIFRNYTKRKPTLELIHSYGTYDKVVIDILRAISKGRGTTIVSGPVKSGKTTLTGALIAERKSTDKMIIVQKDFDELRISRNYPNYSVIELIMDENNKDEIFDLVLRSDYEYIVVGELRSKEAEVFMKACERGLPGAITSYHTPDLEGIPSQIADIILDEQPTKTYDAQFARVAKNIHFAIGMEEMSDKSKKLVKLTVFDWNPDTREFKTHDLISYDYASGEWNYGNYIPQRVMNVLMKYAPNEAIKMQETLNDLSIRKPIRG